MPLQKPQAWDATRLAVMVKRHQRKRGCSPDTRTPVTAVVLPTEV